MKIFKASFETRKFSFESYGETKGQALEALETAAKIHCKNLDVSFSVFKKEYMGKGNISVQGFEAGKCYYDGQSDMEIKETK